MAISSLETKPHLRKNNRIKSIHSSLIYLFIYYGTEIAMEGVHDPDSRSPHFHFLDTCENDRCVEYIKIDEEGNKMEVLLNVSEKEIKVKEALRAAAYNSSGRELARIIYKDCHS